MNWKSRSLVRVGLSFVWLTVLVVTGLAQDLGLRLEPVRLTNSHADFRILFTPDGTNNLSLVLRDEDRRINYATNELILVLAEESRLSLPSGTPFGNEGDPLYVAPQSQVPDLLYLGVSTEGLPSGTFSGNLHLRLQSVEGPGHLFVWQATSFGDFNLRMNTQDGITGADQTSPITGSHEHFNWGFTAPGIYRVTFQASGRLFGASEELVSLPSTFIFHVLPLSEAPALPSLRVQGLTPAGELEIELTGTPGTTYPVQGATELGTWTLLPPVKLVGPTAIFTIPTLSAHRCVRAVLP